VRDFRRVGPLANDDVMGADRCFDVVGRNEVFVTEIGLESQTELHTIAEGGTGCLIGPQVASPDKSKIASTGAASARSLIGWVSANYLLGIGDSYIDLAA